MHMLTKSSKSAAAQLPHLVQAGTVGPARPAARAGLPGCAQEGADAANWHATLILMHLHLTRKCV